MAPARGEAAARYGAPERAVTQRLRRAHVNKVQLLLDTTLGLINVDQNNIIKVLTIVSVVGIPPTPIDSMYGMNFKGMPEYEWAWGYPYGLAMIALSAILPVAWFKWRGWI